MQLTGTEMVARAVQGHGAGAGRPDRRPGRRVLRQHQLVAAAHRRASCASWPWPTQHARTLLPEVPTFAESRLPAMNAVTWFAVVAPPGTPRGRGRTHAASRSPRRWPCPTCGRSSPSRAPKPAAGRRSAPADFIRGETARWNKVIQQRQRHSSDGREPSMDDPCRPTTHRTGRAPASPACRSRSTPTPDIAAGEQERIFRGPVWNYLCLEAEMPEPGDYRTTFVGEMPVVVVRDEDGEIYAFENRCAHRGALIAWRSRGTGRGLPLRLPRLELRPPGQPDRRRLREAASRARAACRQTSARRTHGPRKLRVAALLRPGLRQLQRGRARHRGLPRRRDRRAHRARAAQAGRGHRPLHPGAAEQLEALHRERQGHLPREPAAPVLHHLRAQPAVAEGRRDRRRERRPPRQLLDDRPGRRAATRRTRDQACAPTTTATA